MAQCRNCSAEIKFEKIGGKWVPMDPGTLERHRCQLDQNCQDCGKTFQGAPWMTQCRDCWDQANLDKNRVNRGREKAPAPAQDVEPLNEDWDDSQAPF